MTREEAIKVLRTESIELGGSVPSVCRFLEAMDMAVKAFEEVPDKNVGKNEPLTNAQKIRVMSDEELAEFLIDLADDGNLRIREWLQQPAEEDDMTDCKHEFVYDELHGEIVCKFCGYVLTADDKRELHRKAFELMEDEEGAD